MSITATTEKQNQQRMNQKQRTAKAGEVYAFYIEMLERYGACQILEADKESICYVLLDYLKEAPPEASILEELKPYHREAFRNHHHMVKSRIDPTPVPRDYRYIGQCGLKSDSKCGVYSWKWPAGEDYYYEERWRAFDEDARAAYKKYINSGDQVCVHGRMFRKNTGGLRDELYQCLTGEDTLDDFPCITYAEVQGYSKKLGKWLCTAPLLKTLRLKKAGVEALDLGNTSLDHIELDLDGIQRLILPGTIRSLSLYGEAHPELQIDDHFCSGKIDLYLSLRKALLHRFEMERLGIRVLGRSDVTELPMEQVPSRFPEVESLRITGKPGTVIHMEAVGRLQGLRSLYCKDLFGYSAEELEALEGLSELRELDFDSIPREAGLYLKKYWKRRLDRIGVSHLRNEGWMKENLENPLRHWDGNEFIPGAAYRSARKCYKDTRKQLSETADRDEIKEIVRRYTRHFNMLNERYDQFIETEEREDIFLAMQKLYEECVLHGECGQADEKAAPLTLSEIWDVMDEVRDNW